MSKFKPGDEVVIVRDTTLGGEEFHSWMKVCIKTQYPLIVEYVDSLHLGFKGVGWIVDPCDVEKYQPIMENE